MSLSQSLGIAVTGLMASARGAETVASNLANLRTEGYGRRELQLVSASPGVAVAGVTRHTNPVLLAERRLADSATAGAAMRADFHASAEKWLGLPDDTGSLESRINRFEQSLIVAAEAPNAEARLAGVLYSANALAAGLRETSVQVQNSRLEADRGIASEVRLLNETLAQVASINRDIPRISAMGRDISSLIDQRQVLIDKIASMIPLREVSKDGGTVALYTMGGVTLLDGVPASFGFSPSTYISAEAGGLSGLTINGKAVSVAESGPIGGGSLAAGFAVRDLLGPELQKRLDGVAYDLLQRVETVAGGQPALFTDAGAASDPTAMIGLAERITVNASVDPALGGDLWRLRSGIGAGLPGDAGDGSVLTALEESLARRQTPAYGGFSSVALSLFELASGVLSGVAADRLKEESATAHAASRRAALTQLEAEGSVDSDREASLLMMIERSYAANARVIQAVDEMLENLLRI